MPALYSGAFVAVCFDEPPSMELIEVISLERKSPWSDLNGVKFRLVSEANKIGVQLYIGGMTPNPTVTHQLRVDGDYAHFIVDYGTEGRRYVYRMASAANDGAAYRLLEDRIRQDLNEK